MWFHTKSNLASEFARDKSALSNSSSLGDRKSVRITKSSGCYVFPCSLCFCIVIVCHCKFYEN